MKIWIDGSGWNGKESKYCVAFEDGRVFKKILFEKKTNNEMEYEALLEALDKCSEGDEIFTDSRLVVGQVTENWKVTKEHLFSLVMKAKKLIQEKKVKLSWITREENYAGGLLE